ncbi:hypothetical protein ACS0TY_017776 [Phlomoides rotata]
MQPNKFRQSSKLFHINPLETTIKSFKCGFFAFVDKKYPVNKLNFSACQTSDMNKSILTTCNKVVGRANYVCGHNTDCIDTNFDMLNAYRCKCRNGFTGNPYLLKGCQEGIYFCLLNHKRMSTLLIILEFLLTLVDKIGLASLLVF